MVNSWRAGVTVLIACALVCLWSPALAEEKDLGWSDTAEFSFVMTDGNSETSTFGLRNTTTRTWEKAAFVLKLGGVRVESTSGTRFAFGPSTSSFSVQDPPSETTAENYYINGTYDREITDRLFWLAGAGWERNRFAGTNNRYTAYGGVGNVWVDEEKIKFRTEYSLTFVDQEDLVEDPDADDQFIGARFSWVYLHQFTDSTTYGNDLILDDSLEDTSDLRADMTNWVSVVINKRMALKVSLQWLYDKEPALEELILFDAPGGTQIGTVLVELDDLDTIFTSSLVISF
jgi:putative salt-induced outer membrane protein YdiY